MKQAMIDVPLGDDVYGDDPTVNDLEQWAAQRHGFEAALFTTSGTQANLLALMSHCERGDEYICGQQAQNYQYEAGGAEVLYPSDFKLQDSEPHIMFQFKEQNAAE
jgi:threonine aldolase